MIEHTHLKQLIYLNKDVWQHFSVIQKINHLHSNIYKRERNLSNKRTFNMKITYKQALRDQKN